MQKIVAVIIFSVSCLVFGQTGHYPKEWWQSFPKKDAPAWEILPQEAGPGEVVLSKRTELGVFSNFGATAFELYGEHYASIEGFWQMMKYPEGPNDERLKNKSLVWPYTRNQVKNLVAFEAKDAGDKASQNMKVLGISWITFEGEKIEYKGKDQARHYELIYAATEAKINQNPKVKALLIKTKGLKLMPDHHQEASSPPAYRYYEILMKIRDRL